MCSEVIWCSFTLKYVGDVLLISFMEKLGSKIAVCDTVCERPPCIVSALPGWLLVS